MAPPSQSAAGHTHVAPSSPGLRPAGSDPTNGCGGSGTVPFPGRT
jgi:hypothetical protein